MFKDCNIQEIIYQQFISTAQCEWQKKQNQPSLESGEVELAEDALLSTKVVA